VSLPLALRNRLAALIVGALHDGEARRGLCAMADLTADGVAPATAGAAAAFPSDLFETRGDRLALPETLRPHAAAVAERAGRARAALERRPLAPGAAALPQALLDAAALFDARLFFETHELLEPRWAQAGGSEREALQGLIQVAVGFEHLANANVRGAAALLHDGAAKLADRRLGSADLDAFARRVIGCLDRVLALGPRAPVDFDWSAVPRFPRT
jgi:hypothetical protein